MHETAEDERLRRPMRGLLKLISATAVVLAVLIGLVGDAGAHSELVASCPRNAEVVSELEHIDLTFDGPVMSTREQPAQITATLSDSAAPAAGVLVTRQTDVNKVEADFSASNPAGQYLVTYAVVAFDGDWSIGEIEFTYDPGNPEATNCRSVPPEPSSSSTVIWIYVSASVVILTACAAVTVRRLSKL